MKKYLVRALLVLFGVLTLQAYSILYAEQFYDLFHQHFHAYPEDINENLFYLRQALVRPFVNPLFAKARIKDREDWRRYRYLFYLHVNLKIVEQYRLLGSKHDKRTAFFYNAPWRELNLKSLRKAKTGYQMALLYWDQALRWKERIDELKYRYLEGVEFWEDEYIRIGDGSLDYRDYIGADLLRVKTVMSVFEAMDESTY